MEKPAEKASRKSTAGASDERYTSERQDRGGRNGDRRQERSDRGNDRGDRRQGGQFGDRNNDRRQDAAIEIMIEETTAATEITIEDRTAATETMTEETTVVIGRQGGQFGDRRQDRKNNASSIPAPEAPTQKPQRSNKGKGKDDHKKRDYRHEDDERMLKGQKQMQKPQPKEQKQEEEIKSIVIPEV